VQRTRRTRDHSLSVVCLLPIQLGCCQGVDLRRTGRGGPGPVMRIGTSELGRGGFQRLGARQRPSGFPVAFRRREQPGGVMVQKAGQ
jgi:hypothetical protein